MNTLDHFSVLNYQGSKKNLLEFIHQNASAYIQAESTILDIFAGTCSVGYSYKREYSVYANDSELYSYIISTALLGTYNEDCSKIIQQIEEYFQINIDKFSKKTKENQIREQELLSNPENILHLIDYYSTLSTVWNNSILLNAEHKNLKTQIYSIH